MIYLLSLSFQTRGEPLFFLSNALREYSALRFGLTIWPYGNMLFERGKVSFKCALSKAVIFLRPTLLKVHISAQLIESFPAP